MTRILVTGGTGALGRAVVRRLLQDGRQVRVASRRDRPDGTRPYEWSTVDYRVGTGLAAALAGVDSVVHCASGFKGATVERHLTGAAAAAGTPHLVFISIVGVDVIPFWYYRTKLAAEQVVRESGVPWTILRTTQFHDLLRVLVAGLARSPVLPVPDLRFQPVDAEEVGARLAELAVGEPAGRVPDLGGPEVHTFRELAEIYLRVAGRRRPMLPIRLPGKAFLGLRAGGNLTPEHAEGTTTFEQYLLAHPDTQTLKYRKGKA